MTDTFAELMTGTGERLGFGPTPPDKDGYCVFDFGPTFVSCALSGDGSMIRLTAPVAEIPGECPAAVLERLLDAQLFFKDTRGAAFSYQKGNGAVLLHLNVRTAGLDSVMLEHCVTNMHAVSERFAKEIADMLAASPADGPSGMDVSGDSAQNELSPAGYSLIFG
ncbi:MAG: type III secretion system chaperone [Mailhella sp.]|nr:type III secretion system chaperone [Mailhella sp.]